MNLNLKIREKNFRRFIDKIPLRKNIINDLMVEIPLDNNFFNQLQINTINYLSESAQTEKNIKNEAELLSLLKNKKLRNMTPNGSVISKNVTSFEYNLLAKSYFKVIKSLKINSEIERIHFPFNIRIKYPQVTEGNLTRFHPTEFMHSDGWTGASPNWVAIHIFLFGDVENNNIRYAYPPSELQESWLGPKLKSAEHQYIGKKFEIIDYTPKKGHLVLADNSVIHQSHREKNCGIRVSLDTGFDILNPELKKFYRSRNVSLNGVNVEEIRSKEEFDKNVIFGIGETSFFNFPDGFDDHPDNQSGFAHAARPKLINLVNRDEKVGVVEKLMSDIKSQLQRGLQMESKKSGIILNDLQRLIKKIRT